MFLTCLELSFQTILLGMEAQSVIGLRLGKLAQGGPAAFIEAHDMVAEKAAAVVETTATFFGGGSVGTVVRRYRALVQANEARLLQITPLGTVPRRTMSPTRGGRGSAARELRQPIVPLRLRRAP